MVLVELSIVVAVLRLVIVICGLVINVSFFRRYRRSCCTVFYRYVVFVMVSMLYLVSLLIISGAVLLQVCLDSRGINSDPSIFSKAVCWPQILACDMCMGMHLGLAMSEVFEFLIRKHWRFKYLVMEARQRYLVKGIFGCVVITTVSTLVLLNFTYTNRSVDCGFPKFFQETIGNTIAVMNVQALLCALSPTLNIWKLHAMFSSLTIVIGVCFLLALSVAFRRKSTCQQEVIINELASCSCPSSLCEFKKIVTVVTAISALWILILRPILILICIYRQEDYFDIGTHLLLTSSVILPFTFTSCAIYTKESELGILNEIA